MSASAGKAVFLSYASQDAEAAKRICEALRAACIEVWLDQEGGLVGGDAWDRKIREQIGSCALFVPIVSANTQARKEGYFRLEWKLAAQRTHMMSERTAFLLPVVIDATRDADADVPAEFRALQWTKLPGGEAPVGFVSRVKKLLGGEVGARPPSIAFNEERPGAVAVPGRPRATFPRWAWGVVAFVVLGLGIWALLPRIVPVTANSKPQTQNSKPMDLSSAGLAKEDKSIAVLPFANLSEDKDANAFFADGIHEEILTNLALISELRVVSRTSVEQYRKTTKSLPQIARELGVAWILEGSVFRAGNKVRVTGQLIRAATDEHAWAKSFSRDLTDIFAIQAELAQSIAGSLQAAISPREKNLLESPPTANLAAYDLFLKSQDIQNREGLTAAALQKRAGLYQSAVELDPGFVKAWCNLSAVLATSYLLNFNHTAAQLAKAKTALDAALRLAPDLPEGALAAGWYYYAQRDYPRALEQYDRVARLQPKDAGVAFRIGSLLRRQGKWAESMGYVRRATELDPTRTNYAVVLTELLYANRRFDEAIAEQRRKVGLVPDSPTEAYDLAALPFFAAGSAREAEELFARLPAAEAGSPRWLDLRKTWARCRGDFAEAVRLDRLQPYFDGDGAPHWEQAVAAALTFAAQSDRAGARSRLGSFPAELRARLELEPDDDSLWSGLARMEMLLDHPEEALRCARKATELVPVSLDAMVGPGLRRDLASVLAWTGDKDGAIEELARLLRAPIMGNSRNSFLGGGGNVYEIRFGPEFFPLHGDPRFEALLKDPKNNAPLF